MRRLNRRSVDWLELVVSLGIALMIAGFFWSIGQIGKPISGSQSHYETMTTRTQSRETIK